jgi:hypothetical protein
MMSMILMAEQWLLPLEMGYPNNLNKINATSKIINNGFNKEWPKQI